MGGHRLATDRVDMIMIAECPDGCTVIEAEASKAAPDALEAVIGALESVLEGSVCKECGETIDYVRHETPSQRLE